MKKKILIISLIAVIATACIIAGIRALSPLQLRRDIVSLSSDKVFEDNRYNLGDSGCVACKYGDHILYLKRNNDLSDSVAVKKNGEGKERIVYRHNCAISSIRPIDGTHLLIENDSNDERNKGTSQELSYISLDLLTGKTEEIVPVFGDIGGINWIMPLFNKTSAYIIAGMENAPDSDENNRKLFRLSSDGVYEPIGTVYDYSITDDAIYCSPDSVEIYVVRGDERQIPGKYSLDTVYSVICCDSIITNTEENVLSVCDLESGEKKEYTYHPVDSDGVPVSWTGVPGPVTLSNDAAYFSDYRSGIVKLPNGGTEAVVIDKEHTPEALTYLDGKLYFRDGGTVVTIKVDDL